MNTNKNNSLFSNFKGAVKGTLISGALGAASRGVIVAVAASNNVNQFKKATS